MNWFLGILAGGKSERFGTNKALFEIGGVPILCNEIFEIPKLNHPPICTYLSVHNQTQWLEIRNSIEKFIEIRQSTNEKNFYSLISRPHGLDLKVHIIYDVCFNAQESIRSPLIGLYSIWKSIIEEYGDGFIQILPCDMPHFDSKIINAIYSICDSQSWSLDALILKWKNEFIEPLNSIYRAKIFFQIAEKNILEKNYRLKGLVEQQDHIEYLSIEDNFSQIDPLFNAFKNYNFHPNHIQVNNDVKKAVL